MLVQKKTMINNHWHILLAKISITPLYFNEYSSILFYPSNILKMKLIKLSPLSRKNPNKSFSRWKITRSNRLQCWFQNLHAFVDSHFVRKYCLLKKFCLIKSWQLFARVKFKKKLWLNALNVAPKMVRNRESRRWWWW